MRIDWKKQLAGFLLATLFITFTLSGLMLINLTFTITPFAIYGQPVTFSGSVGAIMLMLALICLLILLKGRGK